MAVKDVAELGSPVVMVVTWDRQVVELTKEKAKQQSKVNICFMPYFFRISNLGIIRTTQETLKIFNVNTAVVPTSFTSLT